MSRIRHNVYRYLVICIMAFTLLHSISQGADGKVELRIYSYYGHDLYCHNNVDTKVSLIKFEYVNKPNKIEVKQEQDKNILTTKVDEGELIRVSVPYQIFAEERDGKELFYQELGHKEDKEPKDDLCGEKQGDYEWPYVPRIRYTCAGFDIADSAVNGTACEYTFKITQDTTIKFNWEVAYALDVVSLVEQATEEDPLIQDDELRSLGNPLYNADDVSSANLVVGAAKPYEYEKDWDWGRVWIPKGKTVEIDVGRTGFQLEPPDLSDRFVVHRYRGRGSAPSSGDDFEPSPTFSIDHFIMNEPSQLVLRWKKQLRVKLGPILKDNVRLFPFVNVIRGFKGGPNPLYKVQHDDRAINAVAVTPDGKYAISGDSGGKLIVWDTENRTSIRELKKHTDAVNAVAVTPDGKYAISGDSGGKLIVWDIGDPEPKNWKYIKELKAHRGVIKAVAVAHGGKYTISCSDDKTQNLKIWETETLERKPTLDGHENAVNAVAVTSDGKYVISGSSDKTLIVWDIGNPEPKNWKYIKELKGHKDHVNAVAVTPDGEYVISGSSDKTLIVWDIGDPDPKNWSQYGTQDEGYLVNAVAVTPDGEHAISALTNNTLTVREIPSGELIHSLERHTDYVNAVAITPDGKYAISGSSDKTLIVWYEGYIQKQEDWYRPYADLGQHDMPERWFDHGISMYIGTPYRPGEGLKLKGWHTAGGHFTLPQGHIPSSLLTEKENVELQVNGKTETIDGISYGLEIDFLTRPTFVTWDYGDMIFKFDVPIGDCLDPKLLNESANRGKEEDHIKDWEGNEINRDNMPFDINLDIEPTFTIVDGAPPGSSPQNTMVWDEVGKRLLPLRPGRYLVEFKTEEADQSVFVEMASGFFGDEIPNSAQQEAEEADRSDTNLQEKEEERDVPWLGPGRKQKVKVLFGTEAEEEIGILARYLPELGGDWKQNYKKAHYRHIAGAPVVSLDPDANDKFHFLELVYFEADTYDEGEYPKVQSGKAAVSEGRFTNGIAGRSVLLFSQSDQGNPASFPATGDRTQEMLFARVVETRDAETAKDWNDTDRDMIVESDTGTIGTPLSSDYNRADLKTGWLYQDDPDVVGRKLYDPDIYNQENVKGPIIPVNRRPEGWSEDKGYRDEIVVVWYENLRKETDTPDEVMDEPNINWPWKPVHYPSDKLKWPPDNPDQIVMASRLGSAGLNSKGELQLEFRFPRYTDVRIYHQPDPDKPGYNPNEEHAIIADSIFKHELDEDGNPKRDENGELIIVTRDDASPPPAAFAFRKDLNITSGERYTSEPYVLVEYFDNKKDNDGEQPHYCMAVYDIEYESDYIFKYPAKVGEPLDAPYPLNKVIGLSNMNDSQLGTKFPNIDGIYFRNGTDQATYWIDPSGVAWTISGPTEQQKKPYLLGHFYYPLLTDFWNDKAKAGDKQMWLPGVETSNGKPDKIKENDKEIDGPGKVRFNTVWPENLPILKIGETLMYAGGEYRADNPITELEDSGKRADTPGLPGVIGWKAGQILFDSRNPRMTEDMAVKTNFTARLLNPLMKIEVPLNIENIEFRPGSEGISVDGLLWRFTKLPASLQRRVYYDPQGQTASVDTFITGKLGIRGYVSGRTLGDANLTADPDPVFMLEPNILTATDKEALEKLFDSSQAWKDAVDQLYKLSWNPNQLDESEKSLSDESERPPYLVGLYSAKKLLEDLKGKELPEVNPIYQDSKGRIQAPSFGTGLALVPNPAIMDPANEFGEGYITLVENAHPTKPDLSPVTIYVVKLESRYRYRGHIKTLLSPNVFDEKAMLSHTGDFGGNVDELQFDWWYRPAASDVAEHPLPPEGKWEKLTGESSNQVVLEGKPSLLLGDYLFFVRYRHENEPDFVDSELFGVDVQDQIVRDLNECTISKDLRQKFEDSKAPLSESASVSVKQEDTEWLITDGDRMYVVRKKDKLDIYRLWQWAGAGNSPQRQPDGSVTYLPQLMMGWVKRVLDAINPYEARFSTFRDHDSPATYASMIQQAGGPYVGPVALNPDKDVIESVGLIQLYQTLLERARKLSIDLTQPVKDPPIQMALLLAATRVSDLYMLLGNEAYADAQDPTIGIGTDDTDYGKLAPALFAFQNQEASLLHEELALLRGTDFSKGKPVQNRLFWNFVKGQGEAAYATNYNIKDANNDGFINEYDAKLLYPQGHGDAWGHYLSASKAHYTLLQHSQFHWYAQPELYNLMDIVLNVDFLDEVKFARTAAARAQAGAEIVNLTYRLAYAEKSRERWQGLHDRDKARAWGVSEWAKRTGQAALFDWVVANALMPYEAKDKENNDEENLKKIDRVSVHDIRVISANHGLIQSKLDEANNGLNPLGLVNEAVAFDIDPVRVDRTSPQPATHFEQIYERAVKSAQNAVAVWDYANELDERLRQVEESVDQFCMDAVEQDITYRNRLIEIFGLPYEGTIGPGQPYPEGYVGPDTMLYFYVDQAKVLAEHLPQIDGEAETNFIRAYGEFVDCKEGYKTEYPGHDFNEYFDAPDDPKKVPLKLPFIQGPQAIFAAPPEWGKRRAFGKLQEIYSRLMLAEFEYNRKLAAYRQYVDSLSGLKEKLGKEITGSKGALDSKKRYIRAIAALEEAESEAKILYESMKNLSAVTKQVEDAAKDDSIPKLAGLSNDLTFPIRGALGIAGIAARRALTVVGMGAFVTQVGCSIAKTATKTEFEIKQLTESNTKEEEKLKQAANSKFKDEVNLRLDIYAKLKEMEQLGNLYLTTLQEGMRLIDERYAYNKRLASGTQQNRYQDMTFRVMRNDALQKYRSTFDLAARYVYLAAMAYDYETNLDPDHPGSVQGLLDDVIRTRTLGQWIDGEPRMGKGGLAEILAKLKDNFDVLNGQLGFNNPQTETGRLSLRRELFRIEEDADWKAKLQEYRVDDLWEVQEFRLYCRPFAPPDTEPQPGIVIPFETEITEGSNFFGNEAQGLDHVYDPSQYATKIRSVGLWFSDYPSDTLVQTPRVYLIPAGTDIMLIPDSPTLEQRRWDVADQRIPVPHKIGHSDLENPNWIPAADSLSGSFAETRKFSRFRAYHDKGEEAFDASEMTWDSRLVGRSVWNTKWLLIIPGSALHNDPATGLDTLIGSDGSKGISDIKLLFQTYSHSGN